MYHNTQLHIRKCPCCEIHTLFTECQNKRCFDRKTISINPDEPVGAYDYVLKNPILFNDNYYRSKTSEDSFLKEILRYEHKTFNLRDDFLKELAQEE